MNLNGDRDSARLHVLGAVAVSNDGALRSVRGQQGEVLSALIAAYPAAVRTEALFEAIWPGEAPKSAKSGLGVVVHRLRARIAAPTNPIENDGGAYRLALPPTVFDHTGFLSAAAAAQAALDSGQPNAAADQLSSALQLWRGPAVDPFAALPLVQPFAAHLEQRRNEAEELLLGALLEADRNDDAATQATLFVEREPYRERRWELLMTALYRSDRQAEALQAAQRVRQILREDLGIEPSKTLRKLEADILNQEPSLDRPTTTNAPADIGHFVSKLRTQTRQIPQVTANFVGRTQEILELIDAFESHRLVCIVGPSGAGKSTLAAHYAHGSADRRPIWMALSDVPEAALLSELAGRLGVRVGTNLASDLTEALNGEPTLLVLDSVEGARSAVAEVAEALLAACEGLHILLTGQVAPGSPNERALELGPLTLEAGRSLLLKSAFGGAEHSTIDPGELDVLLRQLDVMPLHLELVAPALRSTPPDQLCQQLSESLCVASSPGQANERHRTLVAAFDWSYGLLSADEADVSETLGVMDGQFTVEDAAVVTGRPINEVRATVSTLASHSLLERGLATSPPTFRQSPSIRTHARQRLASSGRLAKLENRHTDHYVELVASASEALRGPNEEQAVARLAPVEDQLRATHERLVATGDTRRSAAFARNMWEYSFLRQRFSQFHWLPDTLAMDGIDKLDDYEALLGTAALAAWARNDFARSHLLAKHAEDRAITASKPVPMDALFAQFNVAIHEHQVDDAGRLLIAMLQAAKDSGDDRRISDSLVSLTLGQIQLGQNAEAIATAKRSLRLAQNTGNPTSISWATFALGAARLSSDPHEATRLFAASSRLARTVDNQWVHGMASTSLVTCLRSQGRNERARQILVDVVDVWSRSKSPSLLGRACHETVFVLHALGDRKGAASALEYGEFLDHVAPLMAGDAELLRDLRSEFEADGLVEGHLVPEDLGAALARLLRAPALPAPS